ncbi:Wzz/FepE/Etk N-terminal domain-containing protein [Gordonia sp. NPDC003422]
MSHIVAIGNTIRRAWYWLLMGTLAGAAIGALVTAVLPAEYASSARVFVASPDWNDSTAAPNPGSSPVAVSYGDEFTQQRMSSYLQLLTSPVVLDVAAQDSGVGRSGAELAQLVSGRLVPDTVMLDVRARGSSPIEAADTANAVARSFSAAVRTIEKPAFSEASPVQPIIIAPAVPATSPESPDLVPNIVIGAVVGFLLALSFVVLRDRRRIGLDAMGDTAAGVAVLGRLPHSSREIDSFTDPGLSPAESTDVRLTRLRLQEVLAEHSAQVVMLCSLRSSVLCVDAAATLAGSIVETGESAAVVSADPRTMAQDGRGTAGLAELAAGNVTLDDVLVTDETGRLGLVQPGDMETDRTAVICSDGFGVAIVAIEEGFETAIVCAAPILASADVFDLARWADVLVLVVAPDDAEWEIRTAIRELGVTKKPVVGCIVADTVKSGKVLV